MIPAVVENCSTTPGMSTYVREKDLIVPFDFKRGTNEVYFDVSDSTLWYLSTKAFVWTGAVPN